MDCFVEFCRAIGDGQSRFTSDCVTNFVAAVVLTRSQSLWHMGQDASDDYEPRRMMSKHAVALWQTWVEETRSREVDAGTVLVTCV